MIETISISGLKSIDHQEFNISPLTIVTGLNSTGKSTLLQSILLIARMDSEYGAKLLPDIVSDFYVLRNRYTRADHIAVNLTGEWGTCTLHIKNETAQCTYPEDDRRPIIEKNLYYLSANRIGPENLSKISNDKACGIDGGALFGTYEKEKSKSLRPSLIRDDNSYTLSTQVDYWLKYILGLSIELTTDQANQMTANVRYKSDGIADIMPSELGAGVSYLAKILIMCLRASEGDIIMIENPEIHLHPAAQSRLGEFIAFIARGGTQVIIETHCDNLINRVRYEVYAGKIPAKDVAIYYKETITGQFSYIKLDRAGRYTTEFPEGFFDATLSELIEMD